MQVKIVEVVLNALLHGRYGHIVAIHAFEIRVVILDTHHGMSLESKWAIFVDDVFWKNFLKSISIACRQIT